MATRTRRVVTAIDATGKAFSEIHRETQVGDKWYPEDPVPLQAGGADAVAWKEEFNAAQQAENTQLKADIVQLNADHATAVKTLNAEHAAELSEQASDHSQTVAALEATIDDLSTAKSNLMQQLAEATAMIETLQAQVDTIAGLHETITSLHETMETQQQQLATAASDLAAMTADRDDWKAKVPPPPAPREVTPSGLLARVMSAAPSALAKIWNSEKEIAAIVAATLFTHPGLINLDSDRLKELLGGLVQAELLTQEEMEKVLE